VQVRGHFRRAGPVRHLRGWPQRTAPAAAGVPGSGGSRSSDGDLQEIVQLGSITPGGTSRTRTTGGEERRQALRDRLADQTESTDRSLTPWCRRSVACGSAPTASPA